MGYVNQNCDVFKVYGRIQTIYIYNTSKYVLKWFFILKLISTY